MTDFVFSVIITLSITLLTILAEWLTDKLIIATKTLSRIRKTFNQGYSVDDATKKVEDELTRYETSKLNTNIWGSDLATVTIALDCTALGIWITNNSFFPFVSRFNSPNVERDIYVWMCVLIIHLVLYLITVTFKHLHFEKCDSTEFKSLPSLFTREGLTLNVWKLSTNSLGFLILLSGIVIFTNSI